MSVRKPLKTGNSALKHSTSASTRKILWPSPELTELLSAIFDQCHEPEDSEAYLTRRRDFVFHMTDWLNDLQDLHSLQFSPEGRDPAQASTELMAMLVHVIPHLNAAGRLLLGKIPDPFAGD